MSYRLLHRCLMTGALLSVLAFAPRTMAKPPDLPINSDHTVTPDTLPDSDGESLPPAPEEKSAPAPDWFIPPAKITEPLQDWFIYPSKDTEPFPVGWMVLDTGNDDRMAWLDSLRRETQQEAIY